MLLSPSVMIFEFTQPTTEPSKPLEETFASYLKIASQFSKLFFFSFGKCESAPRLAKIERKERRKRKNLFLISRRQMFIARANFVKIEDVTRIRQSSTTILKLGQLLASHVSYVRVLSMNWALGTRGLTSEKRKESLGLKCRECSFQILVAKLEKR